VVRTAASMRSAARRRAAVLDKVKATAYLATDRVHVLRQAIICWRKAGTISIPGVYVGMGDKIPLGAAINKASQSKPAQTHVQAYTKPLLRLIEDGEIDPSFVVAHPASLEDGAGHVQEIPRRGRRRHQSHVAAGRLETPRWTNSKSAAARSTSSGWRLPPDARLTDLTAAASQPCPRYWWNVLV
jgi:hypothetical protein